MAKGIGLIGNFKGKVGNTVGYKLTASNNGQTQGIRVYQPIVKNPKSAGQAEQRAKLLAVNATYRALKMVIDRGNEGLPYGNKSRLAWLKTALKAEKMPWFVKGSIPTHLVGCQLTKGTLSSIRSTTNGEVLDISCNGVTAASDVTTIGKVSTLLKTAYAFLKEGDQITIVVAMPGATAPMVNVNSFVIDSTSTTAQSLLGAGENKLQLEPVDVIIASAIIVSREGDNGEHLRSTESLLIPDNTLANTPYDADSKAAAIASYRASDASNSDWAEESIQ